MTNAALAALLLVQLAVILMTCRGIGWLFAHLRQPLVVAEMVAGFLLGPSLLGWLAPSVQSRLFAADSKPTLFVLSQIGLVLYMFCVGLEFRLDLVTRYRRRALGISAAGMVAPFALAAALALFLVQRGGFFGEQVRPVHAVLFLGAAMSITAFPVLARIIAERGIAGTTVGSMSLAAGAMDDAAAWIIMAVVLGSVTGHLAPALVAAGGALLYVVVVVVGAKRVLAPWHRRRNEPTRWRPRRSSPAVPAGHRRVVHRFHRHPFGVRRLHPGSRRPARRAFARAAADDRAVDHGALRAVIFRLLGPEYAPDAARLGAAVADHGGGIRRRVRGKRRRVLGRRAAERRAAPPGTGHRNADERAGHG